MGNSAGEYTPKPATKHADRDQSGLSVGETPRNDDFQPADAPVK